MSKVINTPARRSVSARLTVSVIAMLAAMPAIAQEAIVVGDGEVITDTVNLPNEGDSLTVDQGGTIDTDGVSAVDAAGDNVVIDHAGTIITAGDGVEAVVVSGNNATLNISGVIESSGDAVFDGTDANGNTVLITGDNATIKNTGTLLSEGNDADAIDIDGNGVRFVNDGKVSTTNDAAEAVRLDGDDIVFVNTGEVTTIGGSAEAIQIAGDNARVENSGSIRTEESSSEAIEVDGDNGVLINTGIISAGNTEAIEFDGDNGFLDNSGQILTEGDFDEAIKLDGVGYVVVNTGLIQTNGEGSEAVEIDDEARVDNQGTIRTLGANSDGIEVDGVDNFIDNSGLIETAGNGAEAVRLDGARGQLVNSGTLRTTGTDADGVSMNGVNTSLVNSGIISATGDGALAIAGDSDNQTVTLETGSQIRGAIDLGGGEDTLNIGLNTSAVMEIAGVETLNVSDRLGRIDLGDRQVLIETTGVAALDGVTDDLAQSVHRSIDTQIDTATPGPWASLIGETAEQDADDDQLGFSSEFAGLMAGYDTQLGTARLGFVGGVSTGNLTTDTLSYDIDSESAFGGAYVTLPTGIAEITGSLLFGAGVHDSTRFVLDSATGRQEAEAEIDSQFVSAGISARGNDFALGGLTLRPVVSGSYTQTRFDAYTEQGAGDQNLSFDARETQSLNLRGQLEADYAIGAVQTTLRVGVDASQTQADDVSGSLGDQTFSVASFADDQSVLGGFVGARAVLLGNDRLNVTGDIEYRFDENESDALAAGLNVSFRF